jgi:hypothetical protein
MASASPRLPPPFQVTNAMRDISGLLAAVADQVVDDQARALALLAGDAEIRAEP